MSPCEHVVPVVLGRTSQTPSAVTYQCCKSQRAQSYAMEAVTMATVIAGMHSVSACLVTQGQTAVLTSVRARDVVFTASAQRDILAVFCQPLRRVASVSTRG